MRRWLPISCVLSIMLLLSIGPVQSTSVPSVTFYGYVYSSEVATPVEGASVRAWTSHALGATYVAHTNWHGYYEGNGELTPSWYWLQATWESQNSRIECAYYDGGNAIRVDLYIEE